MDERVHKIGEFIEVRQGGEKTESKTAYMVHLPTETLFKRYVAVEGMEDAAWEAMIEYGERVVNLKVVEWETDDADFLFPCGSFIEKYMDFVGFGSKTVEEVDAELMEKLMRKYNR